MQLQTAEFHLTILTPCFSGTALGKDDDHAEMRVPPIRGQIRFWHRQLFDVPDTNRVWGSTHGDEGQGSRVAVRLTCPVPPGRSAAQLLPHKDRGQGNRPALPVGIEVAFALQRLPHCPNDSWNHAVLAAKMWLIAGSLGYRSNRAAGSIWPNESWAPRSPDELANFLRPLLKQTSRPWTAAIAGQSGESEWQKLREAASDTPRGPAYLFGTAKPRTPSPVRFKVVRLGEGVSSLLILAPPGVSLGAAKAALLDKPDPHRWIELGEWKAL